ncbi:hypothetical protein PLESTF_000850400 [Pleodorina starrii]|nr:hypothetical protein PLESTF_000850400 [Pleodorina starrii]
MPPPPPPPPPQPLHTPSASSSPASQHRSFSSCSCSGTRAVAQLSSACSSGRAIPHAFVLTKPFRQTDTDQHPNLLEIAEIFNGRGEASPAQRRPDAEGGALSASVFQELERLGGSENDGAVPTVCAFFPGIQYNLTTTTNPALRHVHNNVATGTGMVLDPREPSLAAAPWCTSYDTHPRAIIIRPDGLDNSIRIGQLQAGEIVVAPITVQFTPHSAQNPQPIRRYGFPLEPAYAATDYYVQGATFRGFWVAHLAKPPTGSYHRASLYVLPTRFTSLANFFLLTPLWPAHDPEHHEEKKVKQRFHKLAGRDPDLAAEWDRLTVLDRTAQQYDTLLLAYERAPWCSNTGRCAA